MRGVPTSPMFSGSGVSSTEQIHTHTQNYKMQKTLDSHIHLWPHSSLSPSTKNWMSNLPSTHLLAKTHGLNEYLSATAPNPPEGVIYVETDRYLPSPTPPIPEPCTDEDTKDALRKWAAQSLEEIKFLRRIIEGNTEDGDQSTGNGQIIKGCVIWAPFNLSPSLFKLYLSIAEETAGPALWEKIVGFRYLLQGKPKGEVESLVKSKEWIENIVFLREGRKGKGWTFDVGIDSQRDGVEMLEYVSDMITLVRQKEKERDSGSGKPVRFILSKPPLLPTKNNKINKSISNKNRPPLQTPPLPSSHPQHPPPRLDFLPHLPLPRHKHLHEALQLGNKGSGCGEDGDETKENGVFYDGGDAEDDCEAIRHDEQNGKAGEWEGNNDTRQQKTTNLLRKIPNSSQPEHRSDDNKHE